MDDWYPTQSTTRRPPWLAPALAAAAAAILGAVVASSFGGSDAPAAAPKATTTAAAAPVATTTTAAPPPELDPCKGLTGDLVTRQDGGQDSPLKVAAALQYAFYVKRDTATVVALYDKGVLDKAAIANTTQFISEIPPGTKYCLAATSAGATAVNYIVKEYRPSPDPHTVPTPTTYAMTLTVTSGAPYRISDLHQQN